MAESEEVLNKMEESAVIKDLSVCLLPDAPPETRFISCKIKIYMHCTNLTF